MAVRTSRCAVCAGLILWLLSVGIGFSQLWQYAYTAGPAATAFTDWPSPTLKRAPRPTLVMVLHPECACSQASIGELARIVARTPAPLDTIVLFTTVTGATEPEHTSLWAAALDIPGVRPVVDHNAIEARRFGAHVSGQAYLFDATGRLIFSGGLTAARGHAGDNDGEDAVLTALAVGRAPMASTPVYGCLLEERARS